MFLKGERMNTERYRQKMYHQLVSHETKDWPFVRYTKSIYTHKTVYTLVIGPFQFSFHGIKRSR